MRSTPTNICRPETDLNRIKRGCETGLHQVSAEIVTQASGRNTSSLTGRGAAVPGRQGDKPLKISRGRKAMQENESAIGRLLVPTPPQPIECGNPASSSNRFAIVRLLHRLRRNKWAV